MYSMILKYNISCHMHFNIPPTSLPNSQKILLHVFVADDAFGLKPHMMKRFPFQIEYATG